MIKTNYDSNKFIKPEGEYEVMIGKVAESVTPWGKEYISIPMEIRRDVQQPYGGGKIYHNINKSRNPNTMDLEIGGYYFWRVMQLCEAVGIPSGTNFESLEDILRKISGKPVRVTLAHKKLDNGKTYENIRAVKPTQFPDISAAPVYAAPEPEEDDGDLPF